MAISDSTLQAAGQVAGWLVHIGLPAPLRLSSLGDLTLLGYDWESAGVEVAGPTVQGNGARAVTVTLPDPDLEWPALVMAFPRGVVLEVWEVRRKSDGSFEAQQEFSGSVEGPAFSARETPTVTIPGVSTTPDTRLTPRISWASDYARRRGEEVTIGNETFILE